MRFSYLFLGLLISSQVLADANTIILRASDNTASLKLSSSVTRSSSGCTTTASGENETCGSGVEFLYHTEAVVKLSVVDDPAFNVAGEELRVLFSGEDLTVTSLSRSQTVFLMEESVNRQILRNKHVLTFNVRLVPQTVAKIEQATAFKNFQVRDGILSFETGVAGEEARTRVRIFRHPWLGYSPNAIWEEALGSRVTVEPFAGGLKHRFDVREAGQALRGRMEFHLLRDGGLRDTRNLTKFQRIDVRYR